VEGAGTTVRFVVVGAGRLGASLALALRGHGSALLGFTARTSQGRANAESWLGMPSSPGLPELVGRQPDLYILAVPDQALPTVAGGLAALLAASKPPHHPFVAHTSGATSVDVLAPCVEAGGTALVFHPLQTFTDAVTGAGRFLGAAIAVTTSDGRADSPAAQLGFGLAITLGARPFLLPDDKRGLYHTAATVACNYLVTLEHQAKRLFVTAGLPEEQALSLFLPLVETTLANIATHGTVEALTGPLSRGDTDTIATHLAALAADAPGLVPLYRVLGLASLDIVRARGEIPSQVVDTLAEMLAGPIDSSSF
jgi:predicted short-subunit dehydrogenase-like oxidoreductase (DUF2520 family)